MKYINRLSLLAITLSLILLNGCGGGNSTTQNDDGYHNTDQNTTTEETVITMDDVIHGYKVDLLKDEVYYFPANTPFHEKEVIQPLKPLDFIFEGRNPGTPPNGEIGGAFIPGLYTHMLMYIGKDSDGYAYGIEMTGHKDPNVYVKEDGTVHVDGQLYVYCLGSDYNKECPKTEFTWGVLHHGDHLWAKRLAPQLHKTLLEHKAELLNIVKKDLQDIFPFQLPIKLTFKGNFIDIIDDGRANGADCTDYMVTLLEKSAGVCMDNIYIDAKGLTDYFTHDPVGQQVYFAGEYNPFSDNDLYVSEILSQGIYSIRNNPPRQTACADKRQVVGIPVPNKVFHSQSLVDIPGE